MTKPVVVRAQTGVTLTIPVVRIGRKYFRLDLQVKKGRTPIFMTTGKTRLHPEIEQTGCAMSAPRIAARGGELTIFNITNQNGKVVTAALVLQTADFVEWKMVSQREA